MGRSVSYPKNSIVAFEDVSNLGMVTFYRCENENCECYEETFNDDEVSYDKETGNSYCTECNSLLSEHTEYDEFMGNDDWEFYVENIEYYAKELFPSFTECKEWLSNEDLAILENDFAYLGISEYCGLSSIWITPKDDCENFGLAKSWVNRIENKFNTKFGDLKKIGAFSNGESIYEKKDTYVFNK